MRTLTFRNSIMRNLAVAFYILASFAHAGDCVEPVRPKSDASAQPEFSLYEVLIEGEDGPTQFEAAIIGTGEKGYFVDPITGTTPFTYSREAIDFFLMVEGEGTILVKLIKDGIVYCSNSPGEGDKSAGCAVNFLQRSNVIWSGSS